MIRKTFLGAGVVAVLAAAMVGCQKPDMKEMMKPTPRPAELDKLDMFVGKWEGTGEMKVPGADKPMTSKSVDTFSWEVGKWVLAARSEETMDDGSKYSSLELWMWDPCGKKFRTWWASDHGGTGHGTAWYDEAAKTWHFDGKDQIPGKGTTMVGEGTIKMTDNNTQEWTCTEWDCWKMTKMFEVKGTAKRAK